MRYVTMVDRSFLRDHLIGSLILLWIDTYGDRSDSWSNRGGVVVNGARSANSHYGSVGSIGGGMMGGGGGIGIGGGPPTIVQLLQVPDTMRQTDAPPSDRERVETEIIKSPPPWRHTPPRRRRPPTTRTPPSSPPPPSGWL
jgi:hypothetical protein